MIQPRAEPLSALYAEDATAWLEAMAELAAQGRLEELDLSNLAEYLSEMARRDRREVKSRLTVLLAHLLKWRYQPHRRSRSWQSSRVEHRTRVPRALRRAPSLAREIPAMIVEEYPAACHKASVQTGLPLRTFPAICPWTPEQILALEFWPDGDDTP